MGIINSHEAARASLGSNQEINTQYKSVPNPSATHSLVKEAQSGCPAPVVRMGKIKLNDLASGDGVTCCTTTCGSSLSGSSASQDAGTWRTATDCTTDQQITITLCSDSCWERSLSARAVSSNGDQSPRGFYPEIASPVLEGGCKTTLKQSKWHHRGPRMREVLATLRGRGVRSRSQPPSEPASDCHEGEASPGSRCSPASALRAHILMAEEEHRRRRHTDMGGNSSSASVTHTGRQTSADPEESLLKLRTNRPVALNIHKTADSYWGCQVPSNAAALCPNVRDEAQREGSDEMPPVQDHPLKTGARLAPPPACRRGAAGSSWIADAPPDGRWEVERGVWTRQGVHHNHLHIADDRFKAIAATRVSNPSQPQRQARGTPGATPQPRGIPVAPLAGRMAKPQQTMLQAGGHHVVPITNRGVAAATTIEIAKRRQATDERRRHQQRHIASSVDQQSVTASSQAEQNAPLTIVLPASPSGGAPLGHTERFARRIAIGRPGADGKSSVCHSNCSPASGADERVRDVAVPTGRAASVSASSSVHHQSRSGQFSASGAALHGRYLSVDNGTKEVPVSAWTPPTKNIQQGHGLRHLPDDAQRPPSASRAQQRNAFVANPRANMGAPKR